MEIVVMKSLITMSMTKVFFGTLFGLFSVVALADAHTFFIAKGSCCDSDDNYLGDAKCQSVVKTTPAYMREMKDVYSMIDSSKMTEIEFKPEATSYTDHHNHTSYGSGSIKAHTKQKYRLCTGRPEGAGPAISWLEEYNYNEVGTRSLNYYLFHCRADFLKDANGTPKDGTWVLSMRTDYTTESMGPDWTVLKCSAKVDFACVWTCLE